MDRVDAVAGAVVAKARRRRAVGVGCADGSAHVFDVRAQACMQRFRGDKGGVTGLQFSISGRAMYTSHDTGYIGCWEPFGGEAGCKHCALAASNVGPAPTRLTAAGRSVCRPCR